ncbi:protein IWS1 homolog A-like [Saccostrea echinata]|uniref:protein IWS1 homolog A-like n=1 Tax=Saccostrea echinata TaxID=191078 RepID=UPI002A80B1ED|nr:protein IWS1 homolog A-like [Saccostrea echinata]
MQLLAVPFFITQAVVWDIKSKIRYRTVKCCNSVDDDDVNDEDDKTNLHHNPYTHEDDIKKFNKIPMFIRVFIYDSNYDLKLRKTREIEGQAALITKGEMDISEEDKIVELKRKLIKHQKKLQKSINENIKKMQLNFRSESNRRSKSEESFRSSPQGSQRVSAIISRHSLSESASETDDEGAIQRSESEESLQASLPESQRVSPIISKRPPSQTLSDSDDEGGNGKSESKERVKSWLLRQKRGSAVISHRSRSESDSDPCDKGVIQKSESEESLKASFPRPQRESAGKSKQSLSESVSEADEYLRGLRKYYLSEKI